MMRLTYIFILLMLGCDKEKADSFLQQNEVQLVAPRISTSSMIIDSTVTLTVDFMMDDVQIVYTIDGSDPKENSITYTKPIIVHKPETLKFRAFHKEWKPSDVAEISLVQKGFNVDSIIWLSSENEKYRGQGAKTLVNHTKASNNFMNEQWMGFDESVQLICSFNQKKNISSIDIGYLNNPGAWIFPPERIKVYQSENGIDFIDIGSYELNEPDQIADVNTEIFSIPINKEIKYLKIEIDNVSAIPEWHDGKGEKAWLFMDEIIFNK